MLGSAALFGQKKLSRQLYSWETPQAKVIETGDLQWQPEAFVYIHGKDIRYIDFEAGDDNNDGKSKKSPWKHHPWDLSATGKAAQASGIFTYVFKRGVVYRGVLTAKESGQAGNPIRLTADPSWGNGEAFIYGSRRLEGGWRKADPQLAPNIPEPQKVWYHAVDEEMPDTKEVCEITGGIIKRVRLARTPNYRESPDDLLGYWPAWTLREPYDKTNSMSWLEDTNHLIQADPLYYKGGTAWSEEDAENMCTIWGQKIKDYDPAKNRIAVGHFKFGGKGCRYFIENTPFLLDTTSEYYLDNVAKRIFLRLDKDKDPNSTIVEVADKGKLIIAQDKHDIVISGLTFGFTTSDAFRGSDAEAVAVIELSGTCNNIEISHNKFNFVNAAIVAKNPSEESRRAHDFLVTDNDIHVADDVAIAFCKGGNSYMDKVTILRNRVYDNGARHLSRWSNSIPAITGSLLDGEIAGNIVDISWGNGLNFTWGKAYRDSTTSLPFIRGLIHHNKATHTLIGTNDYGGIESWQGGPVYVYNNISHKALGYRHFDGNSKGQAFYFDGAFKLYAFNNIATGVSWKKSSAGFMTVLGFYNTYANNTGYCLKAFSTGAVNELDSDGHNFYFANLGDSVAFMFKSSMQPDQATFEAYGGNVFSRSPFKGSIITDPAQKRWFWGDRNLVDLDTYKKNLQKMNPQLAEVGVQSKNPVLTKAGQGDFRPAKGSEVVDRGFKYFVSFPLYANVGEWNFYKHPADSSVIMAENFYMSDDYKHRNFYYKVAENNLQAHGVTLKSFEKGFLEDWTEGALNFDGRQTYCSLDNAVTCKKKCTNVDMDTNNFIIEAFFRTEKNFKSGVLVSKYDLSGNGYKLDFDENGKARLILIISGKPVWTIAASAVVNDGGWHHILAEVDRSAKSSLYVDGAISKGKTSGTYPSSTISLSNKSDLLIGKGPEGNFFRGTLDFLRISRGSLIDARTSIAELYKWELDGPFLRDFTGKLPLGKHRDSGALEIE